MLNLRDSKCIELRNDNSGAIATANNAMLKKHKKRIDLKYHFVCDCHFEKEVSLCKMASSRTERRHTHKIPSASDVPAFPLNA